jgi:hypothetical protein
MTIKRNPFIFTLLVFCTILLFSAYKQQNQSNHNFQSDYDPKSVTDPIFEIIDGTDQPVITKGDPGTESNKFGFEGGCALKYGNAYHIFTTEMYGNPVWTQTKLAHWVSRDGLDWVREATLFQSTGDFTGEDPRAALWSPMANYDPEKERWVLTYVAYNSSPKKRNGNGKIWMALSEKPGFGGLSGPYTDSLIILQAGPESDDWEGNMGVCSFYPFPVGNGWMAFYGSSPEVVGLASAPALIGPWERMTDINPVSRHIENPLVTRLKDGRYIAFFDGCSKTRKIGYMISFDGINWSEQIFIDSPKNMKEWWGLTRTPLGLIQESEDIFTLYFTAYNKNFYEIPGIWQSDFDSTLVGYYASVGKFTLKLIK